MKQRAPLRKVRMEGALDNLPLSPWETPFQRRVMHFAVASVLLNFLVAIFFKCLCGHLIAPGVLIIPVFSFLFAWFAFIASVTRPIIGRIFLMFAAIQATYVLWSDVLDVLYYGHNPIFR
jgi:hypothetical protein